MCLVRTADGFLYIDEQGREISLPDISDEADEPYSAADDDEDDLYEEEAAPRPASAEEDPYGLDDAYFDPYEQIYFSQISDDLYQIASPDGGARLLFAEVDFGYGDLTAVYGRDGKKLRGFAYRNHIMVEHSQPDGLVCRYRYDRYERNGKVLESSNNAGERWTFDYRDGHTVVSDVLCRTETFGFDANRELIYHIDAAGRREESERDDFGRITVQTDALGRQTRFSYDEAGNLVYASRKDHQIKHLGQRIELGDIEAAAQAVEGVERACCVYDARRKRIRLFYLGAPTEDELLDALGKRLPPYMVPRQVRRLDQMPLTKNGKIDRAELAQMGARR